MENVKEIKILIDTLLALCVGYYKLNKNMIRNKRELLDLFTLGKVKGIGKDRAIPLYGKTVRNIYLAYTDLEKGYYFGITEAVFNYYFRSKEIPFYQL